MQLVDSLVTRHYCRTCNVRVYADRALAEHASQVQWKVKRTRHLLFPTAKSGRTQDVLAGLHQVARQIAGLRRCFCRSLPFDIVQPRRACGHTMQLCAE